MSPKRQLQNRHYFFNVCLQIIYLTGYSQDIAVFFVARVSRWVYGLVHSSYDVIAHMLRNRFIGAKAITRLHRCQFLTLEVVGYWCGYFCVELYRPPTHSVAIAPLQWRQNEHWGVSNHQHLDYLLQRLFGRTTKKISKLRVTDRCEGNPPMKMLQFDDVIM